MRIKAILRSGVGQPNPGFILLSVRVKVVSVEDHRSNISDHEAKVKEGCNVQEHSAETVEEQDGIEHDADREGGSNTWQPDFCRDF